MSVWLTEKEFRQSGAEAAGITLNVAFLREIKQDHLPIRELTSRINRTLSSSSVSPRQAADLLSDYRDGIETYFALEEFFGYFENAALTNPKLSGLAIGLQQEHESLFERLGHIIDLAEQIVYHECGPQTTLLEVADLFDNFACQFEHHEQQEMELMLRLCNEEFGVGD